MIIYTPEYYTPSKREREREARAAEEARKRDLNLQPLAADDEG